MRFKIIYTGHSENARKLLVTTGIKTLEEVAFISDKEVENLINEHFVVIGHEDDYSVVTMEFHKKIESSLLEINR